MMGRWVGSLVEMPREFSLCYLSAMEVLTGCALKGMMRYFCFENGI